MKQRVPTPFGILLRRYRVAAMLTQEQLCSRARLSADTIRALESGKRRAPRASTLHLIIDALELTTAERAALLTTATNAAPAKPPANPPEGNEVTHAR